VLVRRSRRQPLVDVPARPVGLEADDDLDLDDEGDGDDELPGDDDEEEVLADEPLARTLVFLVLGFVVMVAGLAAVIAG
jgi:hypothetical protein